MKKLSVRASSNTNILLILSAVMLILPLVQQFIEGMFPEWAIQAQAVIALILGIVAVVIKVWFTE